MATPARRRPMGPRKKNPAGGSHTIVNVTLGENDWLDVMDSEGTWNVAQIVRLVDGKDVEVRYDGWGNEFNEIVPLNCDRVAPYHTYTWSVKCWAKYKNWPWWPSIVTIRSPGNLAGQTYLENENRLFVDFLDRKDLTKRCRCWIEMSKLTSFEEKYDDRRKRTTGTEFEASLAMSLKSTAGGKFPEFAKGTLPTQYKSRIADPVKEMKKRLGMDMWAGSFSTSRERHRAVYSYKPTDSRDVVENEDDEDDDLLVQFAAVSDKEDDTPKKTRAKGKGKAPSRRKARRNATEGKGPTSRRAQEGTDPVVQIQESAHILERPHTQVPARDTVEQPLYLPPIDDQLDTGVPSVFIGGGEYPSGAQRGSQTPVLPPPVTEVPRKRKSRENSACLSVDADGGAAQTGGKRKAGGG